ncbi:hypothetical protein ANCCAN_02677 [Ancylostoma caninum]|uniref:7TM GPCR serpentine receptor class x (Srx) domain-containing protein n=1 Tax=Ancylostoma caninum TaxID=29170 RepID=A0A368H3D0_ANCCA|nr:hypothetical protein ANCCAN_02677 [Ancylostoma caninum]
MMNATLFSINPNFDEVIIGALYLLISMPIIPLYILLLYVFSTDKELLPNTQYRILKQISFLDFGQLLFHVLTGIFILFPEVQTKADGFVRVSKYVSILFLSE